MSIGVLLLNQLLAYKAAGYDVVAICSPGPYCEAISNAGIRLRTVPMIRAITPLADLRALAGLYAAFRSERPSIVHTHTPKAGLLGQYAALAARVPTRVHTIHGLYLPGHMSARTRPLYIGLERATMRFCHLALSQNPEDIETAIDERICSPDRIEYLGNGIDLARFDPGSLAPGEALAVRSELGFAAEDVVVGIVARVNVEKGYREYFEAAKRIAARLPSARFLVVGPVEPEKANALDAHRLAAEAGVLDRVVITGLRIDMPRLYAAMDVLALPSHREGFPRAPMEAAAMGIPVVATDIRGCRQAVSDGETGILVPVGDADALAEALLGLLGDRSFRSRMGACARAHALQHFDERTIVRRTLDAYERLRPPVGASVARAPHPA